LPKKEERWRKKGSTVNIPEVVVLHLTISWDKSFTEDKRDESGETQS